MRKILLFIAVAAFFLPVFAYAANSGGACCEKKECSCNTGCCFKGSCSCADGKSCPQCKCARK